MSKGKRRTDVNEKFISVEEMRSKIKELREQGRTFFDAELMEKLGRKTAIFVEQSRIYFSLWVNEGLVEVDRSKCCCYTCRCDDRMDLCPVASPPAIYRNLRQWSNKFPVLKKGDSGVPVFDGKVSGIMFLNEDEEGKWVEAVSYDMNSAYGWGACQDMPDTRYRPSYDRVVGKGEIGFNTDGDIKYEGEWAVYIYPICSEERHPFKRYMEHWYDIKVNSVGTEKKKAKEHITIAVGYLENKNHLLRAAAIGHVNRLIRDLTGAKYDYDDGVWKVKGDLLFGNTDSIVVKKGTKLDVELGEKMGQWKVENEGWFAYKGLGRYQWKGDKPKERGKSQVRLSTEDDIVTGKVANEKYTLWTWNKEIKDLEEVIYNG